jgi:hypothetical protein
MCPQTPRLSPEYSHKVGLQTVITGMSLQIRPVTSSSHTGPVTMGQITRGPPCWTRSQGGTTSSQVFVRCRMGWRVSLPVVLSPLDQRLWRRHRAKGGVFAFAPTIHKLCTFYNKCFLTLFGIYGRYRLGNSCARICQLYPNASPSILISHFFRVYSKLKLSNF